MKRRNFLLRLASVPLVGLLALLRPTIKPQQRRLVRVYRTVDGVGVRYAGLLPFSKLRLGDLIEFTDKDDLEYGKLYYVTSSPMPDNDPARPGCSVVSVTAVGKRPA